MVKSIVAIAIVYLIAVVGWITLAGTISSRTERTGKGWQLTWDYKDLIAGNGIGIEVPQKINPGPMAARISYFAPVSLGFFFFLIFVISLLRGVRIHPMNYFFLAAAFFAFHLLLAYWLTTFRFMRRLLSARWCQSFLSYLTCA